MNRLVPWAALALSIAAVILSVVSLRSNSPRRGTCRELGNGNISCIGGGVPANKSCAPAESLGGGVIVWDCRR